MPNVLNRTCKTWSIMDWQEENNRLKRNFKFKNFIEAFGFMTKVAIVAEKINHHPTWTNTYNQVLIELCTHDAGNVITDKDRTLAAEINKLI
nr:4a-hydroxytetrahydrobiopterin dehydratase [Chryseosolibacter indicus]